MSLAGNPPSRPPARVSGRPTGAAALLARFDLPVPPRIVAFFEGPERAAHEGDRAWNLTGWSADTRMKVKWGAKVLLDIHEYAADFTEDETRRFLPIAAVGSEMHMFAVDVDDDALPVYFFEHETGYRKWADSFDAFLAKLLKKGERTPSERLAKAYERAGELNEAKQYAELLALLEPIVAEFPRETLGVLDDTRETLGAATNLMGIAYEKQGDIERAMTTYEAALELGSDSASLNICDLWLNHFKDYPRLVAYAESRRPLIWAFSDKYAWFHIRNYLGQGYLLTGRPADAVRAYHQILDGFAVEDPAKVRQAIDELRELIDPVKGRPEAHRATAEAILAWLDTPPPALPAPKLAAMRAWWPALPEPVAAAIREALNLEGEPSDADLARIAALTDLEVEHAKLRTLDWAPMLERLEDLDLEDNELADLAPLAKLPRLRKLDVSENRITSLRPLAALTRLERLTADENPLGGLEGLEGAKQLSYLHVTEAGLTSVEPLRGLPELVEVTVYNNAIRDLSPLAESPRIKEISSFGNPVAQGLAALAALPWLESVDAGDETDAADVRALRAANPLVEIDHFYDDEAEEEDDQAAREAEHAQLRAWWSELPAAWRTAFSKELDSDERGKDLPADEALAKLVREDSLHLDDTPLPDLEPLRRFARLDYLNLGNTGTTDLSPIAHLPRLRDLLIRANPITSLAALAEAPYVEELYAERCRLASFVGLERWFHLRELYAEDNLVDDLAALAELDQLRVLDLEGNRVRSLAPLARLPRLHTLKLGQNQVTDLAPLAGCRALRALEIWANPGVRGALVLADLPDLARVISHGSLPEAERDELRRRRPDVLVD